MDLPTHEGAISMGAMVPLLEASDSSDAQAVVELLESHAILAVLDSEVGLARAAVQQPSPTRVFVPSAMLDSAKAVLEERSVRGTWALPSQVSLQREEGGLPPGLEGDEDETGPIELEPPVAGAVGLRVLVALTFVAIGVGAQRLCELFLGAVGTVRHFGARVPLTETLWQPVTAGFMHGSFTHMFGNAVFGVLMAVVLFGTHRIGATAFVWLVASMVGIVSEAAFTPGVIVIGASAGNYGLVGLWTAGQWERARASLLTRRETIRTLGVLLLLVPGALTPISSTGSRVAVLAHVAGYGVGLVLGGVFRRRLHPEGFRRITRRSRRAGAAAVGVAVSAWMAALVALFV